MEDFEDKLRSLEEWTEQVIAVLAQGDFEEAENRASSLVEFTRSAFGAGHPLLGGSKALLALTLYYLGDVDDAGALVAKSLELAENLSQRESLWLRTVGVLTKVQNSEFEAALSTVEPLVNPLTAFEDDCSKILALELRLSAAFAAGRLSHEDAVDGYLIAAARTLTELQPNFLYVPGLINLSAQLTRRGESPRVMQLLKPLESRLSSEAGLLPAQAGLLLYQLAESEFRCEEFEAADKALTNAIFEFEKAFGTSHPAVIGPLQLSSDICIARGAFGEAENILKEILEIAKSDEVEHADTIAITHLSLARLYSDPLNNPALARVSLEHACSIYEKTKQTNRPVYRDVLWELGTVLDGTSDQEKAAKEMLHSCELSRSFADLCPEELISRIVQTAVAFNRLGEFDKEEALIQETFELAKSMPQPKQAEANSYVLLGACYFRQEKWHDSREALKRAEDFRNNDDQSSENSLNLMKDEFAFWLPIFSILDREAPEGVPAIPGLKMSKRVVGNPPAECKALLMSHAAWFFEGAQYSRAISLYQLVLAWMTRHGVEHPALFERLQKLYRALGDEANARWAEEQRAFLTAEAQRNVSEKEVEDLND